MRSPWPVTKTRWRQRRLAEEILPLDDIAGDTGPRSDTSLERLATLKPAFDTDGTITAGNSSPVSDGASAVLLMSEKRARQEGRVPLAFIEAMEYAAIDPSEGLLCMAPAIAVPRLLDRVGLRLNDIDLIEIHEAFAAQVLANAAAWEQGWKGPATDPVNWDRVNVNGSSISVGHPWAATGGRILTTLAYEMARRTACGRAYQHVCGRGHGRSISAHAGVTGRTQVRADWELHALWPAGRRRGKVSRFSATIATKVRTTRPASSQRA